MLIKRTFTLFLLICLIAKSRAADPLVIAHRGASSSAPENTMPAIDSALAAGADMIEIDVHQSKDSVIYVLHDLSVNRTTNGKGLVKELTSAELDRLDAGARFNPVFAGTKIPRLEEILLRVKGKCKLLIELKKGSNYYAGIEKRVADLIASFNLQEDCLIHSFDDIALFNIATFVGIKNTSKLISGNIPFLRLYADKILHTGSLNKYHQGKGVNYHHTLLSRRFIRKAHRHNLVVYAWTVNKEKRMKKLIRKGIDGIITNDPAKLRNLLQKTSDN